MYYCTSGIRHEYGAFTLSSSVLPCTPRIKQGDLIAMRVKTVTGGHRPHSMGMQVSRFGSVVGDQRGLLIGLFVYGLGNGEMASTAERA